MNRLVDFLQFRGVARAEEHGCEGGLRSETLAIRQTFLERSSEVVDGIFRLIQGSLVTSLFQDVLDTLDGSPKRLCIRTQGLRVVCRLGHGTDEESDRRNPRQSLSQLEECVPGSRCGFCGVSHQLTRCRRRGGCKFRARLPGRFDDTVDSNFRRVRRR